MKKVSFVIPCYRSENTLEGVVLEIKEAMNKLAQRKPKEASVRTDYKGEILVAFSDGSSVNLSTGQYTTPNGVSLAEVGGLKPDVEVPPAENVTMWQEDTQIIAAMEALEESR